MANVIDERNRLRVENHLMKTELESLHRELAMSHDFNMELTELINVSERKLAKSHAALNEIGNILHNNFQKNTTEFPTTEFSRRGHTRRPSSDGQ